jgi:hypothetical protein
MMMMCEYCNVEFSKAKNPFTKIWLASLIIGWIVLIIQWVFLSVTLIPTLLFLVAITFNILYLKRNANPVYFCPECGRRAKLADLNKALIDLNKI